MICYTDQERAVIYALCAKMKDLSAHDISELSHSEPAWKNNLHRDGTIPYVEAFTLVGV